MYLLDTNACIRILNASQPALVSRLRSHRASEIRLCSVVKGELVFGAMKSARAGENLRLLDRFFHPFLSLPFDDVCVRSYGMVRCELERRGLPIGPNDLMIAVVALVNDLTLVTHNIEEFSHVTGLALEDWETQ